MSPNPVDPDIVAAIKEITYRYIGGRESTPAHILETRLGKKRHLLDKAVQDGYLLNLGQKYLRQRLVEASWRRNRRNRARAGTHAISARSSSLTFRH